MSDESSKQSKQNQDKKKRDATTPINTDCYNKWPEHELNPEDIKGTYPLRDVDLFDYNVGQICATKLYIADRCSCYLHDFDLRRMPLKEQTSHGHAIYCHDSKREFYFAVVCRTIQLHDDLGQFRKLDVQVSRRRALREEICAGDLVSTEKRNEAKKLQETPIKKLKDLPMLKTKFSTKADLNNSITPEMAILVSELEASAMKSMELAQELTDL